MESPYASSVTKDVCVRAQVSLRSPTLRSSRKDKTRNPTTASAQPDTVEAADINFVVCVSSPCPHAKAASESASAAAQVAT